MKKIIVCAAALALLLVVIFVPKQQGNSQFLRIHIRADSNDAADQQVKYLVKNAVVEYLTPYLASADTKEKAQRAVETHLEGICDVCNRVLAENGFDYKASATVTSETFPDRTYGGVTLPAGVYDALTIRLGSGSGNNWWCVVYPPLCFLGGEDNGTSSVVFRSRIAEIINEWLKSNGYAE